MHKLWFTVKALFWVIIIVASVFIITSSTGFFGFKTFVVKSGSMEPAIKTGSIIVDKNYNDYAVNDIVTYKSEVDSVTHRIVDIKQDDQGVTNYVLKGDANDGPDPTKITRDMIVGKVILTIPLVGYFFDFVQSLPGLIIFIIIPALIIVYSEIDTIKKEFAKMAEKRKKKKSTKVKVDTIVGDEKPAKKEKKE